MNDNDDSGSGSEHETNASEEGVCNTQGIARPQGGRLATEGPPNNVISLTERRRLLADQRKATQAEGAPRSGRAKGSKGDVREEGAPPRAKREKPGDVIPFGPVAFTVIRVAFDWIRILYRPYVSGQVWKALLEVLWARVPLTLDVPGEETTLELGLTRGAGGVLVAGRSGSGVRIQIRWPHEYKAPTTQPVEAVARVAEKARVERELQRLEAEEHQYGVEVDIQGALLSTSHHGYDVLDQVRDLVEESFYAHFGRTQATRREALKTRTFLGRFDIAIDTMLQGAGARRWIEDEIFCGGSLDAARASWATRATVPEHQRSGKENEHQRMLGTEKRGRTWYLGTNPCFMRVYEKTAHWGGAEDQLRATYTALGWDGKSPVLRTEFQVVRAWFRGQEFTEKAAEGAEDAEGAVIRGHLVPIDEILDGMPLIVERLSTRYRHLAGSKYRRAEDRETSPWWQLVTKSLRVFKRRADSVSPFVRFKAAKYKRRVDLAIERAVRSVVVLEAATDLDAKALAVVLLHTREREDWAEDLGRLYGQVRRELGLKEKPFPTGIDAGRLTGEA